MNVKYDTDDSTPKVDVIEGLRTLLRSCSYSISKIKVINSFTLHVILKDRCDLRTLKNIISVCEGYGSTTSFDVKTLKLTIQLPPTCLFDLTNISKMESRL